jgi:protein-tyrosine phosphatase
MISVMFVCLGNICRSPAGEGILRHLASLDGSLKIEIASSGLGSWHVGRLPDERIREAIQRRGITLTSHAQQFKTNFFDAHDYILAADREVLKALYQYAETPEQKAKIHLITDFSVSYRGEDIPDPYYGDDGSFEMVLDMLEDACEGILMEIKNRQSKKA